MPVRPLTDYKVIKYGMDKGEIVIYQSDVDNNFQMEVVVENETVWLNRNQLSLLFGRDIKTIGKHINNALVEELENISVVAKFATTATDGKVYQVDYYNLDMILSVGYRVKSTRGVQFRIWANKILKDYLLKGYAVHQRFDKIENELFTLKNRFNEFDLQIKNILPRSEGIFYDGQVYDAWQFVSDLIKSAKNDIVVIDNYIDDSVLTLLSKRNATVKATIYTQQISTQLNIDILKHNAQYPPIELKLFSKSHDRFIVIDNKDVFHFGASLKDLGKKWFAFSKMELSAEDILNKLG